jgi:hypothetical protein
MTYRITLTLPCGSHHIVHSLSEATLMMAMGWRFVSMSGRSINSCVDA